MITLDKRNKWDDNNKLNVIKVFIKYQIECLEKSKISFSEFDIDPIAFIKEKVNKIDFKYPKDLELAQEYFWDFLKKNNGLSDMRTKTIIKVRLAICLITHNYQTEEEFKEYQEWFIEVLNNARL
ncbi:hypothetical protein [Winogradskyella marincola]|uniref:Uncharacterized protein n=1 Tax=Winogradskyella marincola TaxID=3037795 RepID=A0ABT6FXP4_9FLAO|nr:hypothetical protein [Winogradskyella sp. YYF002]MDG4714568.1 hypothetical protein [Winogradskyella sp. YYF002]